MSLAKLQMPHNHSWMITIVRRRPMPDCLCRVPPRDPASDHVAEPRRISYTNPTVYS